jgi:hypothetical protein
MSTEKPPAEIWTLAQSHDVKLVETAGLPKYVLAESAEKRIAELEAELAKEQMSMVTITTESLKRACEDGSFCHDMAYAIAGERDSLKRALATAIHEQGQQFKLREAVEAELANARETTRELLEACGDVLDDLELVEPSLSEEALLAAPIRILKTAIDRAKAGEKGD